MGWIRTIAPDEATGLAKAVYDAALRRAGRVFQIVRSMSLAPRVMEASMELYKRVMFERGGLQRYQRELLAVVVSRTNGCHY